MEGQIVEQEGGTGSAWKGMGWMAQTIYTRVNKCKNDKIKINKRRTRHGI
jgi:hypothetical protein